MTIRASAALTAVITFFTPLSVGPYEGFPPEGPRRSEPGINDQNYFPTLPISDDGALLHGNLALLPSLPPDAVNSPYPIPLISDLFDTTQMDTLDFTNLDILNAGSSEVGLLPSGVSAEVKFAGKWSEDQHDLVAYFDAGRVASDAIESLRVQHQADFYYA
jgi:hypothetical protein